MLSVPDLEYEGAAWSLCQQDDSWPLTVIFILGNPGNLSRRYFIEAVQLRKQAMTFVSEFPSYTCMFTFIFHFCVFPVHVPLATFVTVDTVKTATQCQPYHDPF